MVNNFPAHRQYKAVGCVTEGMYTACVHTIRHLDGMYGTYKEEERKVPMTFGSEGLGQSGNVWC